MPKVYRYLLHTEQVLWPEWISLEYAMHLRDTTDPVAWQAGYQGDPSAEGGSTFEREWWAPEHTRFHHGDISLVNRCIKRFITFDTALKDKDTNDYTAFCVGELMPDYTLNIREIGRDKIRAADIPEFVQGIAYAYNRDSKLEHIVIEDTGSGTVTLQWLESQFPPSMAALLRPFATLGMSKEARARSITPYCKHGLIRLPHAAPTTPWMYDFTQELFQFPGSAHDDMVDAFVMMGRWLEYYLSDALAARAASVSEAQ